MSTQRRGCPGRLSSWIEYLGALWQICLAPLALLFPWNASDGTAPPALPARLATKSLHMDHRFLRCDWQAHPGHRRGSPPLQAQCAAAVASGSFGSFLSLIFSPVASERFLPCLPRVHAA